MVKNSASSITASRRPDQRGFALFECLFAMLILTVLAAGLFAGERGGDLVARRALEETVVCQRLESRLEELRAADILVAGEQRFTPEPVGIALEFDRAVEQITCVEDGLFEIEVSISWMPLGSQTKVERRMSTRIAKPEVR